MPTYEYLCEECGNRFDVRQRFSEDPITTCPQCTGSVRRVLHASGVIFKGSGWYLTDSRAKNTASTPTESSTTTSTKTESTDAGTGTSTSTSTTTSDTPTATPAAESKKATPAASS